MIIYDNERIDEVNESLKLIQKTDGLTFGTDAFLLASYIDANNQTGCELGGGTGIISMLLLTKNKLSKIDCVEIQKEYAELIKRNAELNGLTDRLSSYNSDIRNFKNEKTYDVVFTNPPYMKSTSGKPNIESKKNTARHEIFGDISSFCEVGRRLTRFGGKFYAVYRPDRLADIIYAMKSNLLEPKRMTFVHSDKDSEASLVLIEARRGGGVGLFLTKPLFIYKDEEHRVYSDDTAFIYENGLFPTDFYKN